MCGERSEQQESLSDVDFEAAVGPRTAGCEEGNPVGALLRVAREIEAVISRYALDKSRATPARAQPGPPDRSALVDGRVARYRPRAMTAKEKLRERVEALTEQEAAETLRLLDQRADPLTRFLDDAPLDDEPVTPEEEAAVQVAREEIARGEVVSAEEIRREFA